jgi:hypothetical protein
MRYALGQHIRGILIIGNCGANRDNTEQHGSEQQSGRGSFHFSGVPFGLLQDLY